MRKVVAVVFIAVLLVGGYALSPLWVAMDLRRAVLTGDVATLEARVDWPAVRKGLKDSLAEIEASRQAETVARGLPRPSLWQRIKAAASPVRFTDQLIDRYVTPDGVVRLAAARGNMNALVGRSGEQADDITLPDHSLPLADRAHRFWNRLKRITVLDVTSLELEVADRRVPARSYVSTLAFHEFRWRVVDVRVRGAGF